MLQALRFIRASQSGLITPFGDAAKCASALLGVQSQILNAAFVSIFNRTQGLRLSDLEQAVWDQKTLIHAWGQRGTLHLYHLDDWSGYWIASHRQRKSWFQRQYFKNTDDYQRLKKMIHETLVDKSQFNRDDLQHIADVFGKDVLSAWGGILIDLSFEGTVCNLGKLGSKTRYGYTPNWLGSLFKTSYLSEQEANIYLLESYFKQYAPATFADFCHWRGVTRRKAAPWWAAVLPRLQKWTTDEYFVHQDVVLPDTETHFTKLLYRFDPLLLAYKDKTWLADKQHHKAIWAKAAHVNPVVFQQDGVTALWNYQKSGSKNIDFWVQPLQPLAASTRQAIEQEAARLSVFLERKIGAFVYKS